MIHHRQQIQYIHDEEEALKDTWNEENAALIENRVARRVSGTLQNLYKNTIYKH